MLLTAILDPNMSPNFLAALETVGFDCSPRSALRDPE